MTYIGIILCITIMFIIFTITLLHLFFLSEYQSKLSVSKLPIGRARVLASDVLEVVVSFKRQFLTLSSSYKNSTLLCSRLIRSFKLSVNN